MKQLVQCYADVGGFSWVFDPIVDYHLNAQAINERKSVTATAYSWPKKPIFYLIVAVSLKEVFESLHCLQSIVQLKVAT